jgi:hypothetical protein
LTVISDNSERLGPVPQCQCGNCRLRRQELTIASLRECIRIRTAGRDELTSAVEQRAESVSTAWKRASVLERRNKALALEVEALECDCLALRSELETRE